jgi:membrane fusion protein, heavy metal efflux system
MRLTRPTTSTRRATAPAAPVTRPAAPAAMLVALLATACGGSTPPEQPAGAAATPEARTSMAVSEADARAAGIETTAARTIERRESLQASGVVTFDERRTARLGSLVEGVVDEINVQPGDRVARGAVLARLHSHVVHDAWAGYAKAQAERKRVEAELAYARTAEARAALLVESRALSPQELERARADVNTVVQAMASASAEITRAEQELAHYGVTAGADAKPGEDTEVPVKAPFAGTVIERQATQGSAVTLGTPLVVISDLSRVWIIAEVDEAQIGRVVVGAPVAIQVAAYPGESFSGTLAMVGDVVNAATRRVTLRVEAANADQRLKPQMFATLALGSATPRRVLVVPSRAVQQMEGETVVFVRSGADHYLRRAVTTGTDVAGEIEIVKGLQDGDIVVTAGAFLLKSELLKPAGEEP